MTSTKYSSELKQLFKDTLVRYPNQKFEPETKAAFLQDWLEVCGEVGFSRFEQGVRRARSYCNFFPMLADIKPLIPEPKNDDEALRRELRELQRRKDAGEKFYSLADVLIEFRRRVETGEVKGRDERGQNALDSWASKLRNSEKEYAEKMLSGGERGKSDFIKITD